MSAYDERLAELRELARQALDAVADVGGRQNQPYGAAVDRLERVLGYGVAALDTTDGDLLSDSVRDELTSQLTAFDQWDEDHQTRNQAIAEGAEEWADAL